MMHQRLPILLIGACLLLSLRVSAAEPDTKGMELFEKKIRPALVQHCYQCHSEEAQQAKKLKGGLLLDSREGMRKGGVSGPAIILKQPKDSLLIQALRHEDLKMPPKEKLPDVLIADFVRWVEMGAPDPRNGKTIVKSGIDLEAGKKFWSFQPPRKTSPPEVQDASWPKTDVDRFIRAQQEERGLKPVRDGAPLVVFRRLCFDLVGLPPTVEELAAFEQTASRDPRAAIAAAVDRLLASPRFGERWARHWLDVTRYAESNGNADNIPFLHAWRYRDWVIDAFNQDKPYDQFIREQVAGDLLPAANDQQADAQRIATGFLALASRPRAQNNPEFDMDLIASQIEVCTTSILGLTVACARCHDHKFDPIPTREYYALAGIFDNSKMLYGFGFDGGKGNTFKQKGGFFTLSDESPAMGVREGKYFADCRICIRGEAQNLGDSVPRGFLTVVSVGPKPTIPDKASGRLELAQWLTGQNPLTARVMVNRIWNQLFGEGLVATVDNFGQLGERPSHPELLDYLAVRFVEEGWSIKKMIRSLVLSRTYQLASDHDSANVEKDPDSRYLWRRNLRRLDAEALRDALLSASGLIDLEPPKKSLAPPATGKINNQRVVIAPVDSKHRSVYLPILRNGVPEILSIFDFGDPSLVVGDRAVTTVPAQALYLVNSPFMVEQSRALARRLLKEAGLDDRARVERAYRIALARPPSSAERERAARFLTAFTTNLQDTEAAWASYCQVLLVSAEFRYIE
jgi:hypothetical protein